MTADQVSDIRHRLRADYIKVLRDHLGRHTFVSGPLLDELTDVAMFQIEHILDAAGPLPPLYGGDHDGDD